MKELGPAVLVEEEILVAVVVVVAPDRAHRDAGAGAVDVGDAEFAGDVLERAVVLIAIQAIEAAVGAVRHVEVGPAVAIEVRDGDRRADRRDLRHDVVELVVEHRSLVHEVHAEAARGLGEREAVAVAGRRRADRGLVQPHHRGQRDDKDDEPDHPQRATARVHVHLSPLRNLSGATKRVWYRCQSAGCA